MQFSVTLHFKTHRKLKLCMLFPSVTPLLSVLHSLHSFGMNANFSSSVQKPSGCHNVAECSMLVHVDKLYPRLKGWSCSVVQFIKPALDLTESSDAAGSFFKRLTDLIHLKL